MPRKCPSKTFLPNDDQSEFEISLRAPEGTSLESTELLTTRIATRVRELAPETAYTLVTVGSDMRFLLSGRREAAEMRAWIEGR